MKAAGARASQHCIEPLCGASYAIDERLYVCPRCGGLLDVERDAEKFLDAEQLRALWTERLASFEPRELPTAFDGAARLLSCACLK